MPTDNLRGSLEQLQKELGPRKEPQSTLLHGEVERYLAQELAEAKHHHSLRERLQAELSYYQTKHPAIAELMERVINQLAELGI